MERLAWGDLTASREDVAARVGLVVRGLIRVLLPLGLLRQANFACRQVATITRGVALRDHVWWDLYHVGADVDLINVLGPAPSLELDEAVVVGVHGAGSDGSAGLSGGVEEDVGRDAVWPVNLPVAVVEVGDVSGERHVSGAFLGGGQAVVEGDEVKCEGGNLHCEDIVVS